MEKDETFLKDEYFHLQNTIDKFDEKSLTIKKWCVTLCMAGIGAAFVKKISLLLLLSAGASFLFWVIEAYWKSFQRVARRRAKDIEGYLNGEIENLKYPYISSSWAENWVHREVIEIMLWTHVFLPHVIITTLAIALFFFNIFFKFISG